MGAKRKVTTKEETLKPEAVVEATVEEVTQAEPSPTEETLPVAPVAKVKKARLRSKKYRAVRAQIDKTKQYDPFAAVELVKKLSYTTFAGTVTAHLVLKEAGMSAAVTLPHSTGKQVRVVIVDDTVLANIQAGQIDFDILISTPQFMPKLAKFAPVLGPKGLMPNPKNGTLTPNPEVQKQKLEGGTVTVKTEKKAPLVHMQIGKTSMDTKDLVENLEALLRAFGTKIVRTSLAATMSPGIKIAPLA